MRGFTSALVAIGALAFTCFVASRVHATLAECPPGHECLSPAQQRCVNAINNEYRRLSSAYGKQITRCIRVAIESQPAVSFEECLSKVDTHPKIIKARTRLLDQEAKYCTETPAFAFTSGAVASQAAIDQELALLVSVFGPDLDAAIPYRPYPYTRSPCQRKLFGQIQRCRNVMLKAFNRCKKNELRRVSVFSAEDLARRCIVQGVITERALTGKPKRFKRACRGGIGMEHVNECGVWDHATVFPGDCAEPPRGIINFCFVERVQCEICLALNEADGLDQNCDFFDDRKANGSCP